MNDREDLIDAIPDIRQNLAEEIDHEEWDSARKSLWQLGEALNQLNKRIAGTEDIDTMNALVDLFNDARDQHADAVDILEGQR